MIVSTKLIPASTTAMTIVKPPRRATPSTMISAKLDCNSGSKIAFGMPLSASHIMPPLDTVAPTRLGVHRGGRADATKAADGCFIVSS